MYPKPASDAEGGENCVVLEEEEGRGCRKQQRRRGGADEGLLALCNAVTVSQRAAGHGQPAAAVVCLSSHDLLIAGGPGVPPSAARFYCLPCKSP